MRIISTQRDDAFIELFANAFHDDLVMNWINPAPEFVRQLFTIMMQDQRVIGNSWTTEGGEGGRFSGSNRGNRCVSVFR